MCASFKKRRMRNKGVAREGPGVPVTPPFFKPFLTKQPTTGGENAMTIPCPEWQSGEYPHFDTVWPPLWKILATPLRKYWKKRGFKLRRLHPQKLVLTRKSVIIYSHQSNKIKNRCEFANNEDKVRFYTGLSFFDSLNAVFLQVSSYTIILWHFKFDNHYFENLLWHWWS